MKLTKEEKMKLRILRIKRKKKQGGERARDERWMNFLDAWCGEAYKIYNKKMAEEKEKTLDSFMFRGKKFLFYNPKKKVRK